MAAPRRLRYVLLGCEARLSQGVLDEVGPWLPPAAVVLSGFAPPEGERPGGLAVVPPAGVARAARALGVPVIELGAEGLARGRDEVAALAPDLLLIACFPHVLDPLWLGIPPLGALNVHPSLLPAYPGPRPLYWQRRNREPRTGVTVHWATVEVDRGPIVAQAGFPLDPDRSDDAVAAAHPAAAGALLRVVLGGLDRAPGARPPGLSGRPQAPRAQAATAGGRTG